MGDKLKQLFDLTGKTAIITGGSSDIGRQLTTTLAGVGAHVISLDIVNTETPALETEINFLAGSFEFHQIDLTSVARMTALIQQITANKPIDILINSARFREKTLLTEFNPDLWDKHFEVNTKVTWMMTQLVVANMIEKKIKGSIINIASMNGDCVPVEGFSAYCASKAAIIQLSKQLVAELSPHGIRINSISPGLIYTSATKESIDASRETLTKIIPLHFIADPSDLDAIILFLASNNASRYVTGANYVIDGGLSTRLL
ncbi:SDR family NAD(P)-dependent oxidoreductase [Legionella sp. W05-934-2]|uniref:SDR family NAD(P)-dependent oxidoreductase n=1 Tax=Legionella sp. W05-934-2 TaxID=1198649 RepID=UPI0034625B67